MMRRYTLDISDRQFVIDVQEISADQFKVRVGEDWYDVTLGSDENLAEATIAPGIEPGVVQSGFAGSVSLPKPNHIESAPRPAQQLPTTPGPPRPAGGGGKATMTAPMPGVILEVHVKPGDSVERGQKMAILDAMKMHNSIGATRSGVIDEVYMSAGQTVEHGAPLLKFKEA